MFVKKKNLTTKIKFAIVPLKMLNESFDIQRGVFPSMIMSNPSTGLPDKAIVPGINTAR